MDIVKIGKTYKNLKRLREILNVFVKYGFEYLVHKMNLLHLIPFRKRVLKLKQTKTEEFELGEKVRLMCEELGPTFIKFGQILSLRSDVFPENFTSELSKLQDKVKPFSFKEVKAIIEEQLKVPLSEIFSSFDEIPYASASMSQVHFATLILSRQKVSVKIQRPDIEKEVNHDIDILHYLARLLEKYIPESKVYNPTGIVEEFAKAIHKELDFTYEASNADRLRVIFKGSKTVYIPKVYFDYSSKKVLVMERIEGIKITDYPNLKKLNKRLITSHLVEAYYAMVFENGFFHADPHPGNIFILKNSTIGFVDFGMTGRLDKEILKRLAYLSLSFVKKDFDYNLQEFRYLGLIPEDEDNIEYENEVIMLLERYRGFPLDKINIGTVISELAELSRKFNIRYPRELILFGKTLFTIEKITRNLEPKFNFVTAAEPYARKYVSMNLSPKKLLKDAEKNILAFYSFIKNSPKELSDIFKKLKKGNLKIEFEHVGLEPLISDLDRSANRLAFSFIIGSLIIGSSIISYTGMFVYGIIGYVLSALLGLWLAVAIIRSGRL